MTGGGYFTKGLKKTTAHAKAKDGKLYVIYYFDCDAAKNQSNDKLIGIRLLDKDGNAINISDDKTFTVVYDSIDEVINGSSITAELNVYKRKKVDGEWKYVPSISNLNELFKLDFAVSPVTLTDPTTGVSILTTTKYVLKNAALMSTEIAEDSDAYKSMLSHCENIYNTMSYRQYYVVDNGQLVTDLGTLVMEFPVTETMNKRGLGIFRTKYIPDLMLGIGKCLEQKIQQDITDISLVTNICLLASFHLKIVSVSMTAKAQIQQAKHLRTEHTKFQSQYSMFPALHQLQWHKAA